MNSTMPASRRVVLPHILAESIRRLPGVISFLDTEHPDYIDRREASLAIDIFEGRWMHFAIHPKAGGRPAVAIAHSPIVSAMLTRRLDALFDAIHPERGADTRVDQWFVSHFMLDRELPTVSFHGNAKSQQWVMDKSAHDWLVIVKAWTEMTRNDAARCAAGVR